MSHLPDMGTNLERAEAGRGSEPSVFIHATRAVYASPVTALSHALTGMLGFLVMSVCLSSSRSRRCNALFGFIAMLRHGLPGRNRMPSRRDLMDWSSGFAGSPSFSGRWLTTEAPAVAFGRPHLSLAGALMSHCYAVLLFVPFIAGRRGVLVLQEANRLAGLDIHRYHHAAGVDLSSFTSREHYFCLAQPDLPATSLIDPSILDIFARSGATPYRCWLCVMLLPFEREQPSELVRPAVPTHEVALAVGLILLPAAAVALAATGHTRLPGTLWPYCSHWI